MNKLRRENLKDYLHLANLNRKYTSEMQWEKSRLNSEGNQIMKRQELLRRHSLQSRRTQEKLNVQFENRKNNLSHSPTLPIIKRSERIHDETISRDRHHTYPSFPVDKADTTFIKMFKHNGIFQPQNKYPDFRRDTNKKSDQGILKRQSTSPEYEIIRLSPVELESAIEKSEKSEQQRERKKKGRRVTWSGVDREIDRDTYDDGMKSEGQSPNLSRINSVMSETSSVSSQRSTRSDSALLQQMQYRSGRSKIETIGIKWKLPPGAKNDASRSRSAMAGNVSRNLKPCATAMNNIGTSVTRTKWGVQRPQSLDTHDMYRAWLEKLEKLKSPSESRQFLVSRSPNEVDEASVEVTVHTALSETQNTSLLGSNA